MKKKYEDARIGQDEETYYKYFYSDFTDKIIDEPEEIWENDKGDMGSFKEVMEDFLERFCKRDENTDELIFPDGHKVDTNDIYKEDLYDLVREEMAENGYTQLDWDQLDVDEYEETYEPDWY